MPRSFREKADPCQESSALYMIFFPFFRSAKPPFMSGLRSAPVGCSRFMRWCYLIIVLRFLLWEGSWARTYTQSPKLGGRAQLFGTNSFSARFLYAAAPITF